jgi:tRNA-2-methylthio-N6-dimethylallyladenosine synthase
VKQVTIFGQNVNAYRVKMIGDASGMSTEMADFATVLEYVVDLSGIERIRHTTSHFNEFAPPLIAAHDTISKLVSHLHPPVQHGSARILMVIKRGYTAMEYKSTVRKLRTIRPDMSMSSDFIVGFPGETKDDLAR